MLVILDRKGRVVNTDRLDGSIQMQRLKALTDRFDHAEIYVDSTGTGATVGQPQLALGRRCDPIEFAELQEAYRE